MDPKLHPSPEPDSRDANAVEEPERGIAAAPDLQPSVKPVTAAFRNILLVVFLIFVCAVVQMVVLWRACGAGMKTAAALQHQGLPTLNALALLQEEFAMYRLHSYEYLFAREDERAGKANAAEIVSARMRAEMRRLQTVLPGGEGQRRVATLKQAIDDLNAEFRRVREMVDADFPAAMQAMDRSIPPRTDRVAAAANELSAYGSAIFAEHADATFSSFGWIKNKAVIFGSANIVVVLGAIAFVQLAARRSRAQLSETLGRLGEKTQELAGSLSLVRATLEATNDGILATDGHGRITGYNENFLTIWKIPPELRATREEGPLLEFAMRQLPDPERFHGRVQELYRHLTESFDVLELSDGRVVERFGRPQRIGADFAGCVWSFRDITARKRAEAHLESVHRQLLETSRQAGMAEVATSVLHNVGNVLNSVNVSATLVGENVRKSKASQLGRVVALIESHATDLGDFVTSDPQGRNLPGYLRRLSEFLAEEQRTNTAELLSLRKNIEHINDIVSMQQSYGKVSGTAETLPIAALVEDTLRMNASSFAQHGLRVIREFAEVPPVSVEKHAVLQILVNLVRNAKQACDASPQPEKTLTLRISQGDGRVRVAVADNGVGIAPEHLTAIFNHGFTTKKDGHGFGLHSAANAARAMGGSLTAQSDGPGQGATFTLELPL